MWHPYFIAKFYQIEMLCFPTPPIPPSPQHPNYPNPPTSPTSQAHRVIARHHIDGCDLKHILKPRPSPQERWFHGNSPWFSWDWSNTTRHLWWLFIGFSWHLTSNKWWLFMKIQPPSQANLQLVKQQTGGCWVAIQEDFIIQQTFGMEMAQGGWKWQSWNTGFT